MQGRIKAKLKTFFLYSILCAFVFVAARCSKLNLHWHTLLPPPTITAIASSENCTLTVAWTEVPGVSYYKVYLTVRISGQSINGVYPVTILGGTVAGIPCDSEFEIRISSVNVAGEGELSPTVITRVDLGSKNFLMSSLVGFWKLDGLVSGVWPDAQGVSPFSAVVPSGGAAITTVTGANGSGFAASFNNASLGTASYLNNYNSNGDFEEFDFRNDDFMTAGRFQLDSSPLLPSGLWGFGKTASSSDLDQRWGLTFHEDSVDPTKGRVHFYVSDGSGYCEIESPTINQADWGDWHFVAAGYIHTGAVFIRIDSNATLATCDSLNKAPYTDGQSLTIGRARNYTLKGNLDSIGVWNRAPVTTSAGPELDNLASDPDYFEYPFHP